MAVAADGVVIPTGTTVFDLVQIVGDLNASLHGRIHIPAPNATARTALASTCGWTPTATEPLVVLQTNTQVLWIYNGTAWATLPADSGWIVPTFANSWLNYESSPATHHPAGYRVVGTELQIRGLVKNVVATTPLAIFTLPSGSRPTFTDRFICEASAGAAVVSVAASGVVQLELYSAGGNNIFVSLAGIRVSLL